MNMINAHTYKLFIDDERWPVKPDWIIARSSHDCKCAILYYGMPNEISFDHDLGGDDTSINFINWLTDRLISGESVLPPGFVYTIHSANPVGAANICGKMDQLIQIFGNVERNEIND